MGSTPNPYAAYQAPNPYSAYQSAQSNPTRRDSMTDALAGFKEGAGDVVAGAAKSVLHPLDALASIGRAMKDQAGKSADAFNRGDVAAGLNHLVGIAPVLGPAFASVYEGLDDPSVDNHELARRVGAALTMTVAPDAVKGAVKGAGAVADVAPAAAEGVKAGFSAAAPDLVKGGAKIAGGAAVSEIMPGGILRYAAGAAPVYSGVRQISRGIGKGYEVGSAAYNAARVPDEAPAVPAPAPSQPVAATPPLWPRSAPGAQSPLVSAYETAPAPSPRLFPASGAAPAVDPPPVPAVTREILDSIAQQMGYKKGFAAVPTDGQKIIQNLAQAALKAPPKAPIPIAAPATSAPTVVPPASAPLRNGAAVVPIRSAASPLPVDVARQLATEMVRNGNATPEMLADPTELQAAMRDLPPGAPKAIANANYAGNQEPTQAAAVYEAAGRAAKSQNLSQMLYDEGMSAQRVSRWSAKAWENAAKDRGLPSFSKASQGEVIDALKKLEGNVK